jgi:hypothetical protein
LACIIVQTALEKRRVSGTDACLHPP